jgi:hypothetical protein
LGGPEVTGSAIAATAAGSAARRWGPRAAARTIPYVGQALWVSDALGFAANAAHRVRTGEWC